MYCTSTKVVVIGTNTKRKAGPRIGSIGYIASINKGSTYSEFPKCVVFSASILFTRYGYESKERLEKKRVLLVAPQILEDANCKKALNRCIATVNKHTKGIVLVVSPIKENLSSRNELYAKVRCRITTEDFSRAVHILFNDPEYGKSHGYYNPNNLVNILPKPLVQFLTDLQKVRKSWELDCIIHEYFYNQPEALARLFTFINRCEVLSLRGGRRRLGESFGGPFVLYDTLFDVQLSNIVMSKKTSFHGEIVKKRFKSLAKEIVIKGSKTIQKHK